jgi:hypothetical protein
MTVNAVIKAFTSATGRVIVFCDTKSDCDELVSLPPRPHLHPRPHLACPLALILIFALALGSTLALTPPTTLPSPNPPSHP